VTDAFNIHRLPLENSQGPADAVNTHRPPLGDSQGPADAFNTHRLPLGNASNSPPSYTHQDIVGIGDTSLGTRPSRYNQDNLRIPSRQHAQAREPLSQECPYSRLGYHAHQFVQTMDWTPTNTTKVEINPGH
jgi:hypothetical protein